MNGLLKDKNILIMGVRNRWSIAWGITNAVLEQGANVILTYLGERERDSVEKLPIKNKKVFLYPCDVSNDLELDSFFDRVKKDFKKLDGVVHAIAHAKSEDLKNSFVNTSRDGFLHAMEISAFSLVSISNRAQDLMDSGGSILTLSYLGAERVLPGYNVMGVAKAALESSVRYLSFDLGQKGIRVNAISSGPVKTLSAKGIQSFGDMLSISEQKSPLKRNVSIEDLGNNAVYLLSDLSSGVTGEVIYVDSGYNIMGI